jgi:hypothetical protein
LFFIPRLNLENISGTLFCSNCVSQFFTFSEGTLKLLEASELFVLLLTSRGADWYLPSKVFITRVTYWSEGWNIGAGDHSTQFWSSDTLCGEAINMTSKPQVQIAHVDTEQAL